MDSTPSTESKNQTAQNPAPEVLAPRADDSASMPEAAPDTKSPAPPLTGKRSRRNAYRPSHKATFVALAVVVVILAVNAGIIGFVLKGQSKSKNSATDSQVTLSKGILDKVGINRGSIGDMGLELIVGPNARFNGQVNVGGNVSIAGQLKLNSKFSATDASLAQLEAGNTSLSQLNVNGDSTLSTLNLRNNLNVTGTTKLQGPVNIGQLLTVSNNINVTGNLAIGGSLSTNGLSVRSLNIDSTLTIGGHVITRGLAPNVGPGGPALGSNGTVGISGNDAAGTVSINIGVGAGTGLLANVAFHTPYSITPRVVITPVGVGGNFYIIRSAGAFSIFTGTSLPSGGYAVDYIVEQ